MRSLCTLMLLVLASSAAAAAPPGELPPALQSSAQPPAQPFQVQVVGAPDTVRVGTEAALRVQLHVPEHHWVYAERTRLEILPSPGYEIVGVQAPPAERKLDPFLEKEVDVYKHDATFVARVRPGWQAPVKAVMHYQGCNESFCFFPQADTLQVAFTVVGTAPGGDAARAAGAAAGAAVVDEDAAARLHAAAERGLLWLLLLAFTAGFATSLTPCVYPMIPITIGIIGARSAGRRSKGFVLSLLYVLGIAVTYSALGTTAALTGSLFGNVLQNVWVVGFVAAVFVLMAMSMFGAFELQAPSGVAGRLNQVQGSGYAGALLLGLIAGIVASPCIGPVLVAMLAYVGAQGSVLLGFTLFFTFALGLGVLFVVLGTFTSLLAGIPRSGNWMLAVKTVFGLLFLGVALYYLRPFLGDGREWMALGAALLVVGLALQGWRAIHEAAPAPQRWGRALGRVALVFGLYGVVAPLFATHGTAKTTPGPDWVASESEGLRRARETNRPMMVDFQAEWCVACKELEHLTFSDPRVIELAERFVPVQVDATHQTAEIQALMQKYGIVGLPWVAFVTPDGTILGELTITGFVDADTMLERMRAALASSGLARAGTPAAPAPEADGDAPTGTDG